MNRSEKPALAEARAAGPDDESAIASLVNTAFQIEAFFKRGDRTSAEEIRELMTRGEFIVVDAAPLNGQPGLAACVYVKRTGDRGYFGMLSIDPQFQGLGLGRALVTVAEAHARAAGCRVMDIHVINLREELPPFYERLGYATTGTLPYPDDGSSTKPCHFIVMTKALV